MDNQQEQVLDSSREQKQDGPDDWPGVFLKKIEVFYRF